MTIDNGVSIQAVQKINLPDGVEANNVFYFLCDFATPQDEDDIMDAIETFMENLYGEAAGIINEDCTIGPTIIYSWSGVLSEWTRLGERTPTRAFTQVGDRLPHGVSLLIRAYTTQARCIGRKYLAGLGEGSQTDNEWTAATLASAADFAAAWITPRAIDASNELLPGSFSTKTLACRPFTDEVVVLTMPAYQRRRRPGVGS